MNRILFILFNEVFARPQELPRLHRRSIPPGCTSTGSKRKSSQRRCDHAVLVIRVSRPTRVRSGEDRLVFPIPPGVHWRDVQPVLLPQEGNPKLEVRKSKQIGNRKSKIGNRQGPSPGKVGILVGGRIKYIDRPGYVARKATSEPVPLIALTRVARHPAAKPTPDPVSPSLPARSIQGKAAGPKT